MENGWDLDHPGLTNVAAPQPRAVGSTDDGRTDDCNSTHVRIRISGLETPTRVASCSIGMAASEHLHPDALNRPQTPVRSRQSNPDGRLKHASNAQQNGEETVLP